MSSGDELSGFSVMDYVVFTIMLAISMGIGVFFAFKGNKNTEDFLMGGRKMSVFPVAISLLSSFISAISILGFSGETYGFGMQMSVMILGAFIGIFLATNFFLPVFYPLKLTSVNEYIEMRFQSRLLRLTVLGTSTFIGLFYTGVCLYAPTLALASVTPISVDTYIIILGIVCTIYSTIGGLKAVVWTDTFQMAVILLGVVSVIVVGCHEVGGISNVWAIAGQYGRTELFDMSVNPYERHNFLNVITMGSTVYFTMYGANQTNLQRACSVSTMKEAKKVYYINLLGMLVCVGLVFFSGLCAFASYAECDPLTLGKIFTKDQILPYFVMDKMGYIYGMPGLFVATLLSGALSSMSSVINSMVAMIWADLLQKFSFFRNMSNAGASITNKLASLLIGTIMIGLAFLAKGFGGILQASFTLMSIMFGPVLGIFTMGVLFPQIGKKGAWSGFLASMAIMTWICSGATMYNPRPKLLPLSVDGCISPNDTLSPSLTTDVNTTFVSDYESGTESSIVSSEDFGDNHSEMTFTTALPDDAQNNGNSSDSIDNWPMMYLYGISYTLYAPLGSIVCMLVAIIVTLVIGGEDLSQVRPELIAPIGRIFLPKKRSMSLNADYKPVDCYDMKELKVPPPHMKTLQPDP